MRRTLFLALLLTVFPPAASAIIVRGKVTTALGKPVVGARIQLIQGQRSVADTISGVDGVYGSRTDQLVVDVALNQAGITPQVSSQQQLLATPLSQLSTATVKVGADQLVIDFIIIPEVESAPGAIVVRTGEVGAQAKLYLRGAPPQSLLTTVDGVTANPLGDAFDLSGLSTAGLGEIDPRPAVELTPTANPLALGGAAGGVLSVDAAEATSLRPVLVYTGDAGNFGAYRNQAEASWATERLDLLGAFSRFDTSNATPIAPFHLITWATDAGYHISAGTSLRAVGRYDTSAGGLPSPFELFRVQPEGRLARRNLFASVTFETLNARNWHNLVRYGVERERAQTFDFATPAAGLPVSITGANGYKAAGIAGFDPLPPREDVVTNRDEATYQTDYQARPWLAVVGEFRFQDERAADVLPSDAIRLGRNHVSAALEFEGEMRHRLFYHASGFFDYTHLLGFNGSPRLGLTYAAVQPGSRKLHGTILHLTASTGSREPSLLEQAATPYPNAVPRSRTLDASVDQNLFGPKLTLRASYFHSQFSHEYEPIAPGAIASQPILSQTLALRSQGLESDLRYQPFQRVLLEGGYNYLAALTERSAAAAAFNPALPAVPIGGLTALQGQRPFHRPPQSGFLVAEYSGSKFNASLKGEFASRSDDSTNLLQTPSLLLPNRNLSPAYASLDAKLSFVATRHVTVFTDLTNLANDRHIAPLGYLSTPFLVRAGLRIRIGGE
jgi:iron complex outermembrane receptor protein/vitamin B12 transporter